ncbi:hypothetical protein R3W88_016765 [Solanum pinnatisectum]|uniref:Uncharacterized protein n=1 Tax=Solanum pinnatisectum TaxID=50273 RepID=A0AAV9KZG4_9SOLN|nr:hypothetical protein R3W88_016765 [Solanum pinnatisectum]
MKFWDWYLKIALVSAMIGGSMEFFMIKTGFYDKAVRDALNPWRHQDVEARKDS